MDLFTTKDDPIMLRAWEELKEQFKLNVDEYTKIKRPPTEIQRFYAGKSIFMTGATGFMGKCFVEKILRDSDLKHLYLLVRPSRGLTIQDKMKKYFSNVIFDRIRKINPNFEDKIVLTKGDLHEENLGLSAEDRQMLIDNVDIMVHNGANVKFNEVVSVALKINVLGTRDMLELAVACKHLKAFAYVSTAYSHCYMKHIKEEFYAPGADLKTIHDMIAADQAAEKGLSEESIQRFLGKWPNIYTFTKSVAEDLVRQYGEKANFACCVYRPSMVLSSYKEPFVGWVGNKNGPTTALLAGALGFMHVVFPSDIIDLVPADYSINALIVIIYDVVKQWDLERRPRVYNFGSSMANPVTLKKIYDFSAPMIETLGTVNSVWHVSVIFTSNKWQFYVLHILLHFIPAIFADLILLIMRKTPRASSICMTATKNLSWLMYFANFGWSIQVINMRKTFERISEEDKKLFDFNIWNLNWKEFGARGLCGGKVFLLHEPLDNIKKSKRHTVLMRLLHYVFLTVIYLVVIYYVVKLFGIINFL